VVGTNRYIMDKITAVHLIYIPVYNPTIMHKLRPSVLALAMVKEWKPSSFNYEVKYMEPCINKWF
jgi:hypothetical protein